MRLQRLACIPLLFVSVAVGGINWKAVWLEPENEIVLRVGESKPYTVMGLNGADVKSNLTKSPELKITSSDPSVLGIDQGNFAFVGKKLGRVEVRISFGDATAVAKRAIYVRSGRSRPRRGLLRWRPGWRQWW